MNGVGAEAKASLKSVACMKQQEKVNVCTSKQRIAKPTFQSGQSATLSPQT